jgi:GNAT superfamily N-acetyltransferase
MFKRFAEQKSTPYFYTRFVRNFDPSLSVMLIRKGEKKDIPSLLRLIKELAAYERAPHEVMVTAEELERDGFGENPVFGFFVAEENGKIPGIALYYIKYSTWKGRCVFLEDIIVEEEFRQKGIGKKLFDAVVKTAAEMKVKRLEWQVLEWNQPAIRFYEKLNANFDSEWINCKLTGEEIEVYNLKI